MIRFCKSERTNSRIEKGLLKLSELRICCLKMLSPRGPRCDTFFGVTLRNKILLSKNEDVQIKDVTLTKRFAPTLCSMFSLILQEADFILSFLVIKISLPNLVTKNFVQKLELPKLVQPKISEVLRDS
uniref:Uncharacterized protein n=1 Tax=Vespula pensylvanica TaxID=30213 RepID=A0A834PFF5_VESPE|nr:hypothetical protein H0235_001262 [Vespula pensylvanica]